MRRSIQISLPKKKQREYLNQDTLFSLMTRFNVNRNDPRMDQHLASWDAYTRWLDSRIDSFHRYCLPSITQQSILPHAWFILFDNRMSRAISALLDELYAYDWIVPLIFGEDWWDGMRIESHEVLDRRFGHLGCSNGCMVRLDSDDALNRRFMATIDKAITSLRREWPDDTPRTVNFPYGALRLKEGYYVEHQVRQFFGIFEPLENMNTPYRHGHRQIGTLTDVWDVFTPQPMFLYTAHDTNISQIAKSTPEGRQPFGDIQGLLGQFGLEQHIEDLASSINRTTQQRSTSERSVEYHVPILKGTEMTARTQVIPALPEPVTPLSQSEFSSALADYLSDLPGDIGVMVRNLDTSEEFCWKAKEIYPTASTLKVPLIYTLYRLADSGKIDLSERITLSYANRVAGSGVLQHMDEGLQPTLRDLAELMIIVSDNWATDLLWNRLTKERVDSVLAEAGLTQTSLPLTILELFATLADVDPDAPETTYEFLRDYLKSYDPSPDNPAMAWDARNDTSSPADMVRLLTLIDSGEGLSEKSREAILEVLKHQNFTTILQSRLPTDDVVEVAHKTGSLRGTKNDVGLVYGPRARYAIALMSRGQNDPTEVADRMSRVARWVYDSLSG